ncbi:MAG: hypothetical protein WCK59_02970 [Candidatus Falkowbacteria bacterium]
MKVLEDAEEKIFCFQSVADAEGFKKFIGIYMHEHGGNGYGGYWVYSDAEITEVKTIPSFACTKLRHNFISRILNDIVVRRTACHEPEVNIDLIINETEEAIKFKISKLPSRQRPGTGDMYRVVGKTPKLWDNRMNTGRVFQDLDHVVKVYSMWDEEDKKPEPKPEAKFALISKEAIMKIEDFCAKIRNYAK